MAIDTVLSRVRLAPGPDDRSYSDVLISQGKIAAVLPHGEQRLLTAQVIDGHGGVAIPGLVNSHAHTHEWFMRGTVWGMPLEPYIARIAAGYAEPPPPEDIYLRTLAACGEMLVGGITSVADDVIHPRIAEEYIDPVVQAYADAGLRAHVSVMLEDLPWAKSIPFADRFVPERLRPLISTVQSEPETDSPILIRMIEKWAAASDRVGVMVSPSAPQRCTPKYLQLLHRVAVEHRVPFHIHIQETLAQAVTGPMSFGSSMIRYAHDLGILDENTMIAHGIWLTDDDIRIVAGSGATVVHNPVSNMKLGSGVARVRDLLDAGVNVALGCDGYTCNDSQDMFEAMKFACLLSCIATPDPSRWLGPLEVIRMATRNGAVARGHRDSGTLDVGSVADVTILDPGPFSDAPNYDLSGQIVFATNRSDVTTVLVNGEVVVDNREPTRFRLDAVRTQLAEPEARFWRLTEAARQANAELVPYLAKGYERARSLLPSTGLMRLVPAEPPTRAREEPTTRSES